MKRLAFLALSLLPACASMVTTSEGMLARVTKEMPLDPPQLERDCDLEDGAACYFFTGRLPALPRLAIFQGVAPPDRAVLSVQVGEDRPTLRYYLFDKAAKTVKPLPIAKVSSRPYSPWRLEQLEIYGLDSAKTYELLLADPQGRMVDLREFRVLKPEADAFRFAFVAGTGAAPSPEAGWKTLLARKPALIFGLGDLVQTRSSPNAPAVDEATLWNRYSEARRALSLYRQPELVPMIATWDDQDFGAVNADPGPRADQARLLHESFFPMLANARDIAEGPGVAKAIKTAGQTFVLFDGRTFREASRSGSHLGRLQEDWAAGMVEGSPGPVWFLAGEPWFRNRAASFEATHPGAFQTFRSKVEQAVRQAARKKHSFPLALAGADSASSGVTRVQALPAFGYRSVELAVRGSEPSGFLLLSSSPQGNGLQVHVEGIGWDSRKLFEQTVQLSPVLKGVKRR